MGTWIRTRDLVSPRLAPGAFNTTTGPVHWELLAKARAVDNQLFVAVCSPARNPAAGYQAWGHSTVVGPFAGAAGGALCPRRVKKSWEGRV